MIDGLLLVSAFVNLDLAPEPPGTVPVSPTVSESPGAVPLKSKSSATRKMNRYNHEVELIFDLPGLLLQMKTEHPQRQQPPRDNSKPIILLSVQDGQQHDGGFFSLML
mgnify:CR=1 FL=1